jgi:CheY-like chemotaxis protein
MGCYPLAALRRQFGVGTHPISGPTRREYPPTMKNFHATILLVDDDEDFLMFLELVFRDNGVVTPIHLLHNGEEAIAYLKGEGKFADRDAYPYPTFIVTDLKMPKADGFAVLQYLKKNPERVVIPTIMLSSSSDEDDIKKAYLLGASSYHVKPMGLDKLRYLTKTLHDYWMTCECPATDVSGQLLPTNGHGKLGERIIQLAGEVGRR